MMEHCLYKEIHDPADDEGNDIDFEKERIANKILGLDKDKPNKKEVTND